MQAELARLSGDRAHVVALRSDHFVQDDQPYVVIRAVEAVVGAEAAVRRCRRAHGCSPAPTCAASPRTHSQRHERSSASSACSRAPHADGEAVKETR